MSDKQKLSNEDKFKLEVLTTPRDQVNAQIEELVYLKTLLSSDPCMRIDWQGSYYEGDEGLKEQMSAFVNLQRARRAARTNVIRQINEMLLVMRHAVE